MNRSRRSKAIAAKAITRAVTPASVGPGPSAPAAATPAMRTKVHALAREERTTTSTVTAPLTRTSVTGDAVGSAPARTVPTAATPARAQTITPRGSLMGPEPVPVGTVRGWVMPPAPVGTRA